MTWEYTRSHINFNKKKMLHNDQLKHTNITYLVNCKQHIDEKIMPLNSLRSCFYLDLLITDFHIS